MKHSLGDIVIVEGNNKLNVQLVPIIVPTTRLYGYVTDRYTGAPIVGAVGTVYQDYDTDTESYDLVTDSQGYYEIRDMLVEVDVTMMVIYADGYITYTNENIPIVEGDNQLNVRMTPI